jgi:hypothetical protein
MTKKKTAEGKKKGKTKRKKGGWVVAVVVCGVLGLLLVCGGVATVIAFWAFNLGGRLDALTKGVTPQEQAIRYLPNKLRQVKSIAFASIHADPNYQKLRAGFSVPVLEDVNELHAIPPPRSSGSPSVSATRATSWSSR